MQIMDDGCFCGKLTLILLTPFEVYQTTSLFCTFLSCCLALTCLITFFSRATSKKEFLLLPFKSPHMSINFWFPGMTFLTKMAFIFFFFCPFSMFLSFLFFIKSLTALQSATNLLLFSSFLDAFQSGFYTDTILTRITNNKFISKNLSFLCPQHLHRTILIISIFMAKDLIQALMHADLINKEFSKMQPLSSSAPTQWCFQIHLHCLRVWTLTPLISSVLWFPVHIFTLENKDTLRSLWAATLIY